jgi:hypothetical protein
MEHHASHPYTVRLPISRLELGDRRFERTFQACCHAARLLSGGDCRIQAVYDDHQRVGYEFAFRTDMERLRLALCHSAIVSGRPLPLDR